MFYINQASAVGLAGEDMKNLPLLRAEELPKIKEGIYIKLKGLLLSKKNNRLIKRHIQEAQKECISLLDLLAQNSNSDSHMQQLQQATKSCLEELLNYLIESQYHYFDWGVYAPKLHVVSVKMIIEGNIILLQAGLKRKKAMPKLQNIICNAFLKFTKLDQATYKQLHYMKQLQISLIKLCNQIGNVDFDELLIAHLLYYDFNENAFIMYCKQRINLSINQQFQPIVQFESLCFFEKSLMVQQEKANFHFSEEQLSVKAQLLIFVRAELHYFKKKTQFLQQKYKQNNTKENPNEAYRVKLSLSADSLAYLIRLLCETDVIEANPRTHLMQFLSRNFQTSGIGEMHLSPQSLGTKYKQVTQSTALGIKALLKRMTKQLEADFGKP